METVATTFAGIEEEKSALISERQRRIAEHNSWITKCSTRLGQLDHRTKMLIKGIDLNRIDQALKILHVEGDPTKPVHGSDQRREDTRTNAVSHAKSLLASNPEALKKVYIGIKNYAHFGDQREDHDYGMGPRHGDTVFSIGLTLEARKRELTPEEIEDALYFLNVWPLIIESKVLAEVK